MSGFRPAEGNYRQYRQNVHINTQHYPQGDDVPVPPQSANYHPEIVPYSESSFGRRPYPTDQNLAPHFYAQRHSRPIPEPASTHEPMYQTIPSVYGSSSRYLNLSPYPLPPFANPPYNPTYIATQRYSHIQGMPSANMDTRYYHLPNVIGSTASSCNSSVTPHPVQVHPTYHSHIKGYNIPATLTSNSRTQVLPAKVTLQNGVQEALIISSSEAILSKNSSSNLERTGSYSSIESVSEQVVESIGKSTDSVFQTKDSSKVLEHEEMQASQEKRTARKTGKSRSADRSELTFKRCMENTEPDMMNCTERVRVWINSRNVHFFDCSCDRRKPTHDLKKIKKHISQLHKQTEEKEPTSQWKKYCQKEQPPKE